MKQNLNDMAVVLKCTVIAIVAAIHFVCLAGIYRLMVRDLMRNNREDIPKLTSIHIGAIVLSGIFTLLGFAAVLLESE